MEELVECIVKRKMTIPVYTGRCVSITALVCCIFLTLVIGGNVPNLMPVLVLLDFISGLIIYTTFRNTNVEFEYDFFGGELTVDKIMSKAKRKRLYVFDFKNLDYMAKSDSPKFSQKPQGNFVVMDYSAHDDNQETYTAVFSGDSKGTLYLKFSPNEELLALLKKLYGRKIT